MTGVTAGTASVSARADLVASLEAVALDALDDGELLDVMARCEALASWAASRQLAAAAEFARRPARIETVADDPAAVRAAYGKPGEWVREFADDEIAARLRISRNAAAVRVRLGCALVGLPATSAALAAGRIDVPRARVIADEVAVLDAATAREVESAVAVRAETAPPARLREVTRRAVLAADPVAGEVRCRRARGERRVWMTPLADGMAEIGAQLPAEDAVGVMSALSAAARAWRASRAPDDVRTMDQLMADAFAAPFRRALETGTLDGPVPVRLARHRGRRASLRVTVAASTLLGLDDAPAELEGYGPVAADVARALAPDARMRRLLTDPRSGAVLDVGTETYRPTAAVARVVAARAVRCAFPGCGWPAIACDLDHVVPWPEGATSTANLQPLCRRHHRMKHSAPARVEPVGDGGAGVAWTLPTGDRHVVRPPAVGLPIRGPDPVGVDRYVSACDASFPWQELERWYALSEEGPAP